MAVTFTGSERPLAEEDVARAEAELGVALPPAYRRFLLEHNGGRPSPADFKITWRGQPFSPGWRVSTVGDFHAIYDGKAVNLLVDAREYKDRLPAGVLPVAEDPGGNLIVIGTTGDALGKIFFWVHELEGDFDETDAANLGFVADDFDAFLAALFTS